MNKNQQRKIKQQLLELKAMHEQRANSNQDALQTVELDQNKVGRLSRIDALQGQQIAQAMERKRLAKLKQIDGALLRIDNDDFGLCFKCDQDIAVERLKFDPTITRCINCCETNK